MFVSKIKNRVIVQKFYVHFFVCGGEAAAPSAAHHGWAAREFFELFERLKRNFISDFIVCILHTAFSHCGIRKTK